MNESRVSSGKFIRDRSVFVTLLVSFLFVFMIPVLIGSIVYVKIEQIMINNAYRSNSAMLEQAKHVANGKTQEIDYLMRQIAYHPKQQLLMQKGAELSSPRDQYLFIDFMKELVRYKSDNTLFDDVYLYFGRSDTILTPTLKTDSSMFFNQIYRYNDMSYDDYRKNILLGNHFKSYIRTKMTVSSVKEVSMITYVQSLPFGETKQISGSLVVLINESQFRDLLYEVEGLHDGTLYILNKEKEILVGPDKDNGFVTDIKQQLTGKSGKFLRELNGEEMFVSYTTSSENGWTFLSVFPKKVVLMQVNYVKKWSLVTVLACLILGTVLCVYLTRRHYTPIRELVRMIVPGRIGNETGTGEQNEMKLISDTMRSLFGKEIELQKKLSQQMPIIRSDFLSRLVRGQVDGNAVTEMDLRFLDIHFVHDWFTVVLIDIDDSTGFMKEDTEREWVLLRFILINVSNEMLEGNGYVFELEKNRIVILMNVANGSEHAAMDVHAFVTRLMDVMTNRFKTSITAGVSGKHEGMDKITECFDEAMIALSYKMIQGSRSILHYDEVRHTESDSFRFPMDLEVQLVNYARNGDAVNMDRLLDSMYQINFNQNRLSPDMGRWFFLDLQSTLLKLMETLRMDYKQFMAGDRDPLKFLTESDTADQMFKRVKAMYMKVCLLMKEERTDHNDLLLQKTIRFIDEHYDNNNLGLTTISDHLNLNPVYVSAFFKKHSGENITDYITRLRIHHAKKLLAEEYTVQEIATRIGYANNIVLTKVFKKVEGVTPGKYRELLKRSEDG